MKDDEATAKEGEAENARLEELGDMPELEKPPPDILELEYAPSMDVDAERGMARGEGVVDGVLPPPTLKSLQLESALKVPSESGDEDEADETEDEEGDEARGAGGARAARTGPEKRR